MSCHVNNDTCSYSMSESKTIHTLVYFSTSIIIKTPFVTQNCSILIMLNAGHSAYSIVSTMNIYASNIFRSHFKRFLSFRSSLIVIYLIFSLVIFNMPLTLLSFRRQKMLFRSLKPLATSPISLSRIVKFVFIQEKLT